MISPLASVHQNAKIDESAQIGPFVFIDDDVEIGAGTIIDANATIYAHTRMVKTATSSRRQLLVPFRKT